KYSAFLFILVCSMASIALARETYGQQLLDKQVSIQLNNATLGEALDRIAKQAGVKFVFVGTRPNQGTTTSLKLNKQPLGNVLPLLLNPYGLSYRVMGKNIVIQSAKTTEKHQDESPTLIPD